MIGKGIRGDIGDDTVVAANALADFGAHAQPVGRIDLGETAEFATELDGVEPSKVAGGILVALEDQLADDAGAEAALVEQRIGHVVVARREANGAAGLAERNQRRRLEHALGSAFVFRAEKAGGADLQIPVARPEILAVQQPEAVACETTKGLPERRRKERIRKEQLRIKTHSAGGEVSETVP